MQCGRDCRCRPFEREPRAPGEATTIGAGKGVSSCACGAGPAPTDLAPPSSTMGRRMADSMSHRACWTLDFLSDATCLSGCAAARKPIDASSCTVGVVVQIVGDGERRMPDDPTALTRTQGPSRTRTSPCSPAGAAHPHLIAAVGRQPDEAEAVAQCQQLLALQGAGICLQAAAHLL